MLFPEDTLPLRVLQPRFKAAVDRAMRNDEALNTIGVIHVRARDGHVHVASIGTTAEVSVIKLRSMFVTLSCNHHLGMMHCLLSSFLLIWHIIVHYYF